MEQLELDLDVREIERLGPEYDENGNPVIPYLPGKYKQYGDYLRSREKSVESELSKANLEWYEEWKEENFTYEDPVDKDRKRYAG